LYRFIAIPLRWIANPLALESSFEKTRVQCSPDPSDMTLEKRLAANSPVYYERNIRNLMILAEANGVQPVISSWVYNVESNRPELWRQSIADHNAITRKIAEDRDIPYIDLAADFPVNSTNWESDGIHLVASGTREQAERYAAFLDENNLIPKP
jgi:lysophospholipase L1-like esterase